MKTPILIVGGGTGGVAAAIAIAESGGRAVLTEETDWIGGQLTAQIVPPDEHPWIEMFGCTASYRTYRDSVRELYHHRNDVISSTGYGREFNPGGGWVSRLCHEPKLGQNVLEGMLRPALEERLDLLLRHKPIRAFTQGDRIRAVEFVNLDTGERTTIEADFVLDATECGDLLWLSGTEYALGSDAKSETGEPNAAEVADPNDVQGLTWCFAMGHDLREGANHVGDPPHEYARWREYQPPFWPGKHLGFEVLHAHTGEVRTLPLYNPLPKDQGGWYELFSYRQIVDPAKWTTPVDPATVVNWPQNDYFVRSILDVDPLPGDTIPDGFEIPGAMGPNAAVALGEAKEMSRSLLHWLQTEAPRHDGEGAGYPGLYAAPHLTGTPDGFAKYPYIREARRLKALKVVAEQEVATYTNPGLDRAPSFADSVGVGAYRIDLHPSTSGATTIDTSTLPFEIPLGSLVPRRMRNLIAAGKCLGVTHITNGCYRLHPVEWNVGEAAGTLAALCIAEGTEPHAVAAAPEELQRRLEARGVELRWPVLRPL